MQPKQLQGLVLDVSRPARGAGTLTCTIDVITRHTTGQVIIAAGGLVVAGR